MPDSVAPVAAFQAASGEPSRDEKQAFQALAPVRAGCVSLSGDYFAADTFQRRRNSAFSILPAG
jgi:predicted ester cyclase